MSKSTGERLIYMANQIAAFFTTQPGDTAPLHIAEHITAFWTPCMRDEITAHADRGGEGLVPAALEAVRLLKRHSDKSVEGAIANAGERAIGHEHGSDAG